MTRIEGGHPVRGAGPAHAAEQRTSVRAGEKTLDDVARRTGVESDALRRLNPHIQPNQALHRGMEIELPVREAAHQPPAPPPIDLPSGPKPTPLLRPDAPKPPPTVGPDRPSPPDLPGVREESLRAETHYDSRADRMVELDLRAARAAAKLAGPPREAKPEMRPAVPDAAQTDLEGRAAPTNPRAPESPEPRATGKAEA